MRTLNSVNPSGVEVVGIDLTGSAELIADSLDLQLNILGSDICFRVDLPEQDFSLNDIVPLASVLSDKIIETVIKSESSHIPCSKGCAECCKYLISLSVPEAMMLYENILTAPVSVRNRIVSLFVSASERILENRLENPAASISEISDWYSSLHLTCPFLDENICSIYTHRPFVCREHLVTGPNPCLPRGNDDNLEIVRMPIDISIALSKLACRLESSQIEFIMLPVLFGWAETNIERFTRRWPASEMVRTFAGILEEMQQSSVAVPLSENDCR